MNPSTYAIFVASGDHTGFISFASGVLVRLTCSEPSGFMTQISQVAPAPVVSHTVNAIFPLTAVDCANDGCAMATASAAAAAHESHGCFMVGPSGRSGDSARTSGASSRVV